MDLILAQALWVLDLLAIDQLPEIAVNALIAGKDSQALRLLAGLTRMEATNTPELFRRALIELDLPEIDRISAARIYASSVSQQIIDGEIEPQEGANKLWDASIQVNDQNFHELDPFIYAASELPSRPEDRDFFNHAIINEALKWASKKATKGTSSTPG
jgi:hypothetical protein